MDKPGLLSNVFFSSSSVFSGDSPHLRDHRRFHLSLERQAPLRVLSLKNSEFMNEIEKYQHFDDDKSQNADRSKLQPTAGAANHSELYFAVATVLT